MATGDAEETAAAIGRTVGLLGAGGTVLTGTQVDALDDEGLSTALDNAAVFARVSPRHKVRIVYCEAGEFEKKVSGCGWLRKEGEVSFADHCLTVIYSNVIV